MTAGVVSLIVPGLVLVLSTEFDLSSLAALIESLLYDESPVRKEARLLAFFALVGAIGAGRPHSFLIARRSLTRYF
ncbi:hypothetical protein RIF29_43358 [Crotalaria pallida]|uniref:Uncharacterized protein n=1 Tax=Crotalaria pallida TaxID=3830 RepID=A0AAN9HNB8_CROPI